MGAGAHVKALVKKRLKTTAVVVVGLGAAYGALATLSLLAHPKTSGACRFAASEIADGGTVEPRNLNVEAGERTSLGFGRSSGIKILPVTLKLDKELDGAPPGQGVRLRVRASDLRRGSDDARIGVQWSDPEPSTPPPAGSGEQATPASRDPIAVRAIAEGTRVTLDVCVARTDDFRTDPGTYTGTVTFNDRRVNDLVVPITVSLSYRKPFNVAILFLPLVVVGTWWVWTIKKNVDPDLGVFTETAHKAFWGWVFTVGGVSSIASGLVGAFATFGATYLRSEAWGGSAWDWFSLFGAMFAAFVAAATVARSVGSKRANGGE